jgi:predicted TIM-barrel enzyme
LTRNPSPCYAFALDEAKAMAEDGADGVIAHLSATTKGSIGAATILAEAPAKVQKGYATPPKVPISQRNFFAQKAKK